MPVQIKQWNGILDTDSSNDTIHPSSHKGAYNIVFRQNRVENVVGTTAIENTLPDGVNVTIGGIYDEVRNRIIYFNYNGNGDHGIYIYDIIAKSTATLLICGTATDGDILNFTLTDPITSATIIYADGTDGDILCFIDSLLRPTVININQYLATPYSVTKRAFIDLAKSPPMMPPHVTYENDTTVTVNNLRNSLFKFYSQFEYDNQLKSVYSTGSITPLPLHSFDPNVDSNKFLNNRISVYVQTGDIDVKKIEIWGQQTSDSNTTDYFLIVSLDKSKLSIPSNSIYRFLFYNDALYPFGTVAEQTLLFDWIPQTANAMELLNGNVLILGGITEGYDKVPVDISYITNGSIGQPVSTYNGLVFFAGQSGSDSGGTAGDNITLYLSGAGTNDGSGNPTTLNNCKTTFVVDCALSNGTTKKFQYYNNTSPQTTANIFSGLATAAVAQGFTVVSTGTNTMVISQTDIVLYQAQVVRNNADTFDNTLDAMFAYAHQAAYEYGVQYFDEKGRTNGTMPSLIGGINTTTNAENITVPNIIISINNRPPLWADSYCITRTKNLTYNNRLTWVCNQTFQSIDYDDNNTYAYIGISNMVEYNKLIQASTPVVTYDFAPGDRIRFEVRYINGVEFGAVNLFDYEILATQVDPILNGVVQKGNFIKILYPIADISAAFDFGGDNYQQYKILIYNYTKHAIDANSNIYYEFGRHFAIGNPHTNTAYHIGAEQTQTANLSQPAIANTTEGDYFQRYRNVPTGNIYYVPTGGDVVTDLYTTVPFTPDQGDITTSSYVISHQVKDVAGLLSSEYPQFTDDKFMFENLLGAGQQIRVEGNVTVQCAATANTTTAVIAKVVTSTGVAITYIVRTFDVPLGEDITSYQLVFDGEVSVPPGAKVWLILDYTGMIDFRVGYFTLKLSVLNIVQIPITESSFSDKYVIVTNSNSRPSEYDQNAKQTYFPTILRWGLADQSNTNINQINKFYPLNFDQIALDGGDIERLKARDRILRVFQTRKTGQMGIYTKFVQDSGGNQLLTTTNDIITKNNVQYYEGIYGIGNNPTSLVSTSNADFFVDDILGEEIRLAANGLNSLSDLYLGKYYIKSLLKPYALPYLQDNGAYAKILGCYDYVEKQLMRVLQGGTLPGDNIIQPNTYSFNTQRNGFCSFYDFHPDWMVSTGDFIYSFTGGELYEHSNTDNYCKFYDTQYYPSIKLVFNDKEGLKKNYLAVSYQSNQILCSPGAIDINTEMINPQTGFEQVSQLIEQDYDIQENQRYAAFLRDANSMIDTQLALVDGDYLSGKWIEVNFVYRGSDFMYFYLPYISWIPSNRNF